MQLMSRKLAPTISTPFRLVIYRKTDATDNDYIGLTEKDRGHNLLLVNCFGKPESATATLVLEPPRFEDFIRKHLNIYLHHKEAYIDWISLSMTPKEIKAPVLDPKMLAIVIRLQSSFRMMRAVRKMKEDMKGVVCRFFKRHDSGHSALVTVYQTQVKVKGKTTTTKTKTETRTEKKVIGSPRPWDVEKKEVLGVTKTQSVEVAEDTIVAYQIVAENARKRSEQ